MTTPVNAPLSAARRRINQSGVSLDASDLSKSLRATYSTVLSIALMSMIGAGKFWSRRNRSATELLLRQAARLSRRSSSIASLT